MLSSYSSSRSSLSSSFHLSWYILSRWAWKRRRILFSTTMDKTCSKSLQERICFGSNAVIKAVSSAIINSWSELPAIENGLSSLGELLHGPPVRKLSGRIFSQIVKMLSMKVSLTVSAKPLTSSGLLPLLDAWGFLLSSLVADEEG